MKHPVCAVRGCTCAACWELIPGYFTGREPLLCSLHWQQICRESSIQAECYRRLA